jgi:hypothetical protein
VFNPELNSARLVYIGEVHVGYGIESLAIQSLVLVPLSRTPVPVSAQLYQSVKLSSIRRFMWRVERKKKASTELC